MKRYPAYDPPEYVRWRRDDGVMAEFQATLDRSPARRRIIQDLPDARLLALYEGMLRFRLHDISLKRWVRQGVLSKAWLGTGEEAVTVGNVHALATGDLVGPMIRNAGACHEMGMPLADMFRAYLGTVDQLTRGRDLHTGDPSRGVVPPISFVGSLVPVMAGMALAARMRKEDRVAMTWVGDGASRTGEFHEGLNFAAVERLPLVVVLQDNGIALGTPRPAHSRGVLSSLARGYGIGSAHECDGNNVLDVHAASVEAVAACRAGRGPALLVASTFRMGGHATHDEAEGRALLPAELFEHWGKRDPVGMYESYLEDLPRALDSPPGTGEPSGAGGDSHRHNRQILERIEARVVAEVEAAAEEALAMRETRMPGPDDLLAGVTASPGESDEAPAFPPRPLGAEPARSRI